ncbi:MULTISPECIES: chloride channel protein [Cyanophyceae]|uniref:Chloride channel protein n=1 Tax=Aphanothece cf. minutissima CCALA 015 TaxID=2107695 RepID=A0ABX5F8X0_9CHRO|nr:MULTISPECIES: chloride channel protein [Cyanophyceae]MCP9932600.1 chloride channel protein [Cyanobium sp. Candia 9D4]PSB37242.1 chloride channel protein [Aphanothece cf. minutissima CCALA 015]
MPASAPKAEASGPRASGPRTSGAEADLRGLPFQWNLLAWAALVGTLTGLAVVAFHELLGFINNFLFGPFVEGLLVIGRSSPATPADLPPIDLPPLAPDSGTPLRALLQLGLDGIGLLAAAPPPPPLPEPPPISLPTPPDWLALWPVVVVPTLGGLAVGLLRHVAGSIGPGLSSLMAIADGRQGGEPRLPWLRLVAASLSLGSGASLGPEGPSVEGGGNIGLWVALRGRLSPQAQKALVGAGVAAGLAAGFKAPIAGVFFAFEGSYSAIPGRPSLRAVLVAAVASALVTQLCLGDTPILRLPAYEVRSPLELPLYLGLGLLASLMSWLLIRLLAAGRDERVQAVVRRLPPGLPTALGGAALGGMALVFPQVLGVGYDTIEALLGRDGGIPLLTLVALIGVKLVATTVSNATGFVGGGFAPSLFLGAVLGSCYGQALGSGGLNLPVAEPPAYAMVGMAAVLAGSARAPLTALLLLFELTRDIRIVLPLMAAAGLSAALVERWQGIQDPGLMGPDPQEERRRGELAAIPVEEAFDPEAPLVLPAAMAASAALARLIDSHGHCLLVERAGLALGLVTIGDLQRGLASDLSRSQAPCLEDCLRTDLVWLPAGVHLDRLEDQLRPNGLRQLPVFAVPEGAGGHLPHGLPPGGLAVELLRGVASRDGMARALARRLQAASERPSINASATGST